MTHVKSDDMTITINSVDYSIYIDKFDISGGTPILSFTKTWNGRKKRAVVGYNEWVISFDMLVDTNTDAFITALKTFTTSYTFVIGQFGVVQHTYSNFYVSDFSNKMDASDGLQKISIEFQAEGLPANKV